MKHRFNVGDKIKVVDEIAVAGVRLDEVFEIQSIESVISNDNEPFITSVCHIFFTETSSNYLNQFHSQNQTLKMEW